MTRHTWSKPAAHVPEGPLQKPKLRNQKLLNIWRLTSRIGLGLTMFFGFFSLSYWLCQVIYKWADFHPGGFLNQMIIVAGALILAILGGAITSRVAVPKQRAMWQPLFNAFRQIAKGNFDVHLDADMIKEPGGDRHPFRRLVYSINDMAQELSKLEQMRQEFISNVSHEIQSPLTSMAGFAATLKSGGITVDQQKRYLDIIETESKRLSRLSDNLLKLTSLESGHHPFHPETYRLDRQLREVVLACEPMWVEKQIQIDVGAEHLSIVADKDLLSQVWLNLVVNAIKFTRPGGSIVIRAKADSEEVTVNVTDTGVGMTQEDASRIFERFFKADKAHSHRALGSGLGLSIAKKIIDLHDGYVQVETEFGTGSTFTVTLPVLSPKTPSKG
ncbi:cell wall metabolism sensor histidine kinase WalK [Alicyclobacillus sp. SO9]|uniref:sensor histidine kinase n=1 Tax=Alicyclobacillus sp. SO9 TaxID=2665646 RepID=UPI0018E90856|nr:HAMP domain-containing sensor histidine kinase [Alicyclobacillus sp. SO9]QQE79932.1 two-component sensor histidine kinase [Alicyclobacillus sp. SO9]